LDKKLIDIIACPSCKGKIIYNEIDNNASCKECKINFPVENGVPILILSKANSGKK
jgi:uncharacterized protein